MSRNSVQPGACISVVAPYAVLSGAGVLLGKLFGIAMKDAPQNGDLALQVEGVFELPKVDAQAWAVGDQLYWDAATKLVTKTAASNVRIGHAVSAAGSPSPIGRIRISNLGR